MTYLQYDFLGLYYINRPGHDFLDGLSNSHRQENHFLADGNVPIAKKSLSIAKQMISLPIEILSSPRKSLPITKMEIIFLTIEMISIGDEIEMEISGRGPTIKI